MRLPGGTKTQVPRPGPCLLPCCPARGSRVILKQSRSVPAGPPWLQERSAPYHTWPEVTFKLAQVSDVGTAALLHPQRCAGPLWCPCWLRGHFFTPAHTCQGALEGGAPGGLRAPAHTQPGRPASPRATRGVVGTALPGVLQGALGNPRQAWLQGALSPPTHTGLCACLLSCVCGLGPQAGLCSARWGPGGGPLLQTDPQPAGRTDGPRQLPLLGSDHNVTPKGSKFIKGFLWGLEMCDRFSIPLNSLLKFNAAIKMMDNKLFQEK